MKNVLFSMKLVVLVPVIIQAHAAVAGEAQSRPDIELRESVVHSTRNQLEVDLNEKTVICSRADYAIPMLKVLIPGLSDVTLLDHQNRGAGAPCVTTGDACLNLGPNGATAAAPSDILQGRQGVESIEVLVTARRIETINHIDKTCTVRLKENVDTVIRGKKLFHTRESDLGTRNYNDCVSGGQS